jgi:outer membrane protein OmpA-like peptidoglycan-associated protein
MRCRVAIVLLLAFLVGCAGLDGKKFSVAFQPFGVDLDPRAQATVQAAAAFAKAHPLMPLSLAGYATRPDGDNFATLRQQRVAVVQDALVREGVNQIRIEILGNGIIYPDGVPDLPPEAVDISIGL